MTLQTTLNKMKDLPFKHGLKILKESRNKEGLTGDEEQWGKEMMKRIARKESPS